MAVRSGLCETPARFCPADGALTAMGIGVAPACASVPGAAAGSDACINCIIFRRIWPSENTPHKLAARYGELASDRRVASTYAVSKRAALIGNSESVRTGRVRTGDHSRPNVSDGSARGRSGGRRSLPSMAIRGSVMEIPEAWGSMGSTRDRAAFRPGVRRARRWTGLRTRPAAKPKLTRDHTKRPRAVRQDYSERRIFIGSLIDE